MRSEARAIRDTTTLDFSSLDVSSKQWDAWADVLGTAKDTFNIAEGVAEAKVGKDIYKGDLESAAKSRAAAGLAKLFKEIADVLQRFAERQAQLARQREQEMAEAEARERELREMRSYVSDRQKDVSRDVFSRDALEHYRDPPDYRPDRGTRYA